MRNSEAKCTLWLQVESMKFEDAEEVLQEKIADLIKLQMERVTESNFRLLEFDTTLENKIGKNLSIKYTNSGKETHKHEVVK